MFNMVVIGIVRSSGPESRWQISLKSRMPITCSRTLGIQGTPPFPRVKRAEARAVADLNVSCSKIEKKSIRP